MLPQQRGRGSQPMAPPGGPSVGGASLSDLLTGLKNLVQAVNGATKAYLNVQGADSAAAITQPTLVRTGQGRLCTVSVTKVGMTNGMIYDTNMITSTANPIAQIYQGVGVYVFNIPVQNGIVVVPGAQQQLTITFS